MSTDAETTNDKPESNASACSMSDREVVETCAELVGLPMYHQINVRFWQWHDGWECLEEVVDDGRKIYGTGGKFSPITDERDERKVLEIVRTWNNDGIEEKRLWFGFALNREMDGTHHGYVWSGKVGDISRAAAFVHKYGKPRT